MENVEYLKTMCPACDGSIEFPAEAIGQRADCPHCHKTIVLGSVAALAQTQKNPSVVEQPTALNQINVNQKILIGVAMVAFIISVCVAPWEQADKNDNQIISKETVYSPVWQQPEKNHYWQSEGHYEYRLLWSPLLGVWIAIGVVFTGSFFLLKGTPSIFDVIKKSKPKP